jgi:hypothetical protein
VAAGCGGLKFTCEAPPTFSWLAGLCVVEAPRRGSQLSSNGSLGEHGRILCWPGTTTGPFGFVEKSIFQVAVRWVHVGYGTSCELLRARGPASFPEDREPSLNPNLPGTSFLGSSWHVASLRMMPARRAPKGGAPDRQPAAALDVCNAAATMASTAQIRAGCTPEVRRYPAVPAWVGSYEHLLSSNWEGVRQTTRECAWRAIRSRPKS